MEYGRVVFWHMLLTHQTPTKHLFTHILVIVLMVVHTILTIWCCVVGIVSDDNGIKQLLTSICCSSPCCLGPFYSFVMLWFYFWWFILYYECTVVVCVWLHCTVVIVNLIGNTLPKIYHQISTWPMWVYPVVMFGYSSLRTILVPKRLPMLVMI